MSVLTITKDNFREAALDASNEKPVLIDFWASWCGPCRMLSPVVDQIAEELDNVIVGKVNVDDEPELAAAFDVQSIPTLVLIKNGEVADVSVGVRPKPAILKMING